MVKICLAGAFVFAFLTGCGKEDKSVAEQKIQNHRKEEIVQEMLADRYGGKFIITSLDKETGIQAFDESYYYATAYNTEGDSQEFDVIVDCNFERIKDNYPSVCFQSSIISYVDELLEKWENNAEISYQVIYQIDEEIWNKTDEWKRYLKESESWISGKVQIRADNPENAAQITYDMTVEWKKEELPFIMQFYYNGKEIVIENYKNIEIESYEQILKKYGN